MYVCVYIFVCVYIYVYVCHIHDCTNKLSESDSVASARNSSDVVLGNGQCHGPQLGFFCLKPAMNVKCLTVNVTSAARFPTTGLPNSVIVTNHRGVINLFPSFKPQF